MAKLDIQLLAPNARYVFYNSLKFENSPFYKKLYEKACADIKRYGTLFSSSGTSITNFGTGYQEAIAFLKKSAEFERQKELQFFQNFETAYPEIKETFKIKVQDILNDYPTFILNINRAIKGTEQFQKELKSEINRIEENRAAADRVYQGKLDSKNMEKSMREKYIDDLEKDKNKITGINNARFFMTASGRGAFQALFDERYKNMRILQNLIIQEYGARIFDKNLNLNEKELNALIAALTMKANELLVSDLNFSSVSNIKQLATSVVKNSEMKNFTETLINSPVLTNVLQSLISQYNMSNGDINEINNINKKVEKYKNALHNTYKQLNKEEKKQMSFEQWLESIGMNETKIKRMIAAANTISVQSYYVGEDLSMLDLVRNHVYAVLGGTKNPTDDIEAGALITTFDLDQKKLNQLENELWKIQERQFGKVTATSTYDSYVRNTVELLKAREEQQTLLQEFFNKNVRSGKAINDLLSHITIHSTVKGYESAGSFTFEKEGGFGGAAFGSTLDSELQIINDMIIEGGLSPLDIDNLFIAMINCGKLMIGHELKPTIENYFSAFMGMFMFNDASLFAQDVNNWIEGTIVNNAVQDLHLYQLNGVVVPSSYILQETYEIMAKLKTIDQTHGGIRAKFSTYNGPPIKSEDGALSDWQATSAHAIANTKLERMHFLSGFLGLLQDLQRRLDDL